MSSADPPGAAHHPPGRVGAGVPLQPAHRLAGGSRSATTLDTCSAWAAVPFGLKWVPSRPYRSGRSLTSPNRSLVGTFSFAITSAASLFRATTRTAGVSGAFIKELLRRAAVCAAEEDGAAGLVVRDRHLDEALAELLVAGGPLTQSLLGVAPGGSA